MGALTIARRRMRVTLEQPAETADDIGGVGRAFVAVASLWARLEPVRGIERTEAQRPAGNATHRLTIRWRAGVTTAMRFTANGAVFAVLATYDPLGARRDLVCLVEEVQP